MNLTIKRRDTDTMQCSINTVMFDTIWCIMPSLTASHTVFVCFGVMSWTLKQVCCRPDACPVTQPTVLNHWGRYWPQAQKIYPRMSSFLIHRLTCCCLQWCCNASVQEQLTVGKVRLLHWACTSFVWLAWFSGIIPGEVESHNQLPNGTASCGIYWSRVVADQMVLTSCIYHHHSTEH